MLPLCPPRVLLLRLLLRLRLPSPSEPTLSVEPLPDSPSCSLATRLPGSSFQ